jgi:hypothetical protein
MALDGISFLPADVSSMAFGRIRPIESDTLCLTAAEVAELQAIAEELIAGFHAEFASGFIAESPEKLRRIPQYYAAIAGRAPFPPVSCNAPWMSVVIEVSVPAGSPPGRPATAGGFRGPPTARPRWRTPRRSRA